MVAMLSQGCGKKMVAIFIAVLSAEVDLKATFGGIHNYQEVHEAANSERRTGPQARGIGHRRSPPGDPFVNGVQI